jgi:CheY-like chemotaxis protein
MNTILLVEDDAHDALLIRRAAAKAGLEAEIEVVERGDLAVAYLQGRPPYADVMRFPRPSFMLLDLKLPRLSGFEVLEWLRGQPGLRRLPVVVLTSSKESGDVDRAYELGANSYLVKPVQFDAMTEIVRSLGLYWLFHNELPRTSARSEA